MRTENKVRDNISGSTSKVLESQKILGTSYRGFVSIDQEMEHVLLGRSKNSQSTGFKNRYYGKGSL